MKIKINQRHFEIFPHVAKDDQSFSHSLGIETIIEPVLDYEATELFEESGGEVLGEDKKEILAEFEESKYYLNYLTINQ